MRGATNVITSVVLVLVALVMVALVMPWAWNTVTQMVDALTTTSTAQTENVLSLVRIIPPPALNPADKNQLFIIYNYGDVSLLDVSVKAMDRNLQIKELRFKVVRTDGTISDFVYSVGVLKPGELLLVEMPADTNYMGYKIILQSRRYSTSRGIG